MPIVGAKDDDGGGVCLWLHGRERERVGKKIKNLLGTWSFDMAEHEGQRAGWEIEKSH